MAINSLQGMERAVILWPSNFRSANAFGLPLHRYIFYPPVLVSSPSRVHKNSILQPEIIADCILYGSRQLAHHN